MKKVLSPNSDTMITERDAMKPWKKALSDRAEPSTASSSAAETVLSSAFCSPLDGSAGSRSLTAELIKQTDITINACQGDGIQFRFAKNISETLVEVNQAILAPHWMV